MTIAGSFLERPTEARKIGAEPFHSTRGTIGVKLNEFWQWSSSDLVSNVTRGRLAEFIVAQALGVSAGFRIEWDAFDILTVTGVSVEVKSCAYLQSWKQAKLTPIQFSMAPTRKWNSDSGLYDDVVQRQAEIYIFALLAHQDGKTLDPLNLDQWHFYAVLTSKLNERTKSQQTISLKSLAAISSPVHYEDLRAAVQVLEEALALPSAINPLTDAN